MHAASCIAPRAQAVTSTTQGFDIIIIGAGAAGCVLANRLSADPACRVALIEAGPSDRHFPLNVKTRLPVGNVFLLPHAQYNWQHEFTGGRGSRIAASPGPRGKLFGGCTSVNGTVYIRGHRLDYDEWAALGNTGWGYEDVLPFNKAHEACDRGASSWHGTQGELSVQRPAERNPLAHAFVQAATQAGFARNDDFNGEWQDGFGIFDLNQRDGVRWSPGPRCASSSSTATWSPAARRRPRWTRPSRTSWTSGAGDQEGGHQGVVSRRLPLQILRLAREPTAT